MSVLRWMRTRLLRAAGVGAAGLTLTGLAMIEVARPFATPCPVVSTGPRRPVRRDDEPGPPEA